MVRVAFTANLRRHLDVPTLEVPGGTVHEALLGALERARALGLPVWRLPSTSPAHAGLRLTRTPSGPWR